MSNSDIPKIVNPNASHMACLFLLDTSGSMKDDGKINQLNTGFNKFIQDVSKNEDTKRILDLAIIAFNSTSSVIQEFAPISYVQSIALSADGGTNMVPAIEKAIEMVRDRSRFYRDNTGTEPYKPWIFLITDGEPTDERNEFIKVADKVNNLVNQGRFKMFAIGVDGYNPAPLHSLCGERVISLNGHDFTDTFDWINKSIRTVSQAAPAANIGVSNLPTTGTMSVDPSKDTTGW